MDPIAIACRYHIHSKKFHYLYDLTKLIFETKTGMDFGEKSAKVAERSATRSAHASPPSTLGLVDWKSEKTAESEKRFQRSSVDCGKSEKTPRQ